MQDGEKKLNLGADFQLIELYMKWRIDSVTGKTSLPLPIEIESQLRDVLFQERIDYSTLCNWADNSAQLSIDERKNWEIYKKMYDSLARFQSER
jgi:hypothetical protein